MATSPMAYPPTGVAVAYPDDPARMYLYRPGQLVVGGRSEGLVAEQLERFGARVLEGLPELDAALFVLPPDVDVPALVEELLADDDRLEAAPNHVFWLASEEADDDGVTPTRIRVPGFGLVGRLLDVPQPEVPPFEPWMTTSGARLIDGGLAVHPLFATTGVSQSPFVEPEDRYQASPQAHATAVLGALLLKAPIRDVEVVDAVGLDGLIDELTLASALAAPRHPVTCVPLGGFSHGDRLPVLLRHVVEMQPGLVLVAAAGNHGNDRPFWPAAMEKAVGVAAIDSDGRLARWSGRGPAIGYHAPGVGVVTAGLTARWVRASGTSIAAAVFTGLLLRAMGKLGLSAEEALEVLAESSPPAAPSPRSATSTSAVAPTSGASPGGQAPPDGTVSDVAAAGSDDAAASADSEPDPVEQVVEPPPVSLPPLSDENVTPAPARTGRAAPGYAADTFDGLALVDGESDPLGIRGDVDVLASVITSARVAPPLSLGIFGDWGSGKTFLMNQVRLQVATLSAASQAAASSTPPRPTYYCARVAQIEFNAWQYVDGQLWASLINRVFEGIRDHLGTDEAYAEILGQLEVQDGVVRQAAERLDSARRAIRDTAEPSPARTVADVAEQHPELKDAVDRFATAIGRKKEVVDLVEVAQRTQELGTLAGRFREGWAGRGRNQRAVLALVIVAGMALLAAATALPGVGRFFAVLGGLIAPVSAVLLGILKPSGDAFRAGVRILDAEEPVARDFARAQSEYDEAKHELDRLRHAGPAGLYRFIEDRYRADDYRQYLGMVPLIRRDLKSLSELSRTESGAAIERIVLYIDDLDRCPTKQVVKVLEAVNLLFGFPLFVVVIAVDSRWLVRSLQEEFRAVFGGDGANAPSPQDYLEKIIQIPFWLRDMAPEGFSRLVGGLLRPPEPPAPQTPAAPGAAATSTGEATAGPTAGPTPVAVKPAIIVESIQPGEASEVDDPVDDPVGDGGSRPGETAEAPVNVDMTPESLVITEVELAFLKQMAPLVSTPRATKRLVNTYQLVRVSIDDVPTFIRSAEYKPVLILLALIAGSPGLSAEMVRTLMLTEAVNVTNFLTTLTLKHVDRATHEGWLNIASRLAQVPTAGIRIDDLGRWLATVSRFSFRPGLAEAARLYRRSPETTPRGETEAAKPQPS